MCGRCAARSNCRRAHDRFKLPDPTSVAHPVPTPVVTNLVGLHVWFVNNMMPIVMYFYEHTTGQTTLQFPLYRDLLWAHCALCALPIRDSLNLGNSVI
ncbi:hypothetical protein VTN77DRAFT_6671 [Rasamsonia byssochlamydoides]|uniref:uncharacterized protein n=1 Tax=Rasamsonia byssochlamydoides TaxID=89139 RepID=UPI003744480C